MMSFASIWQKCIFLAKFFGFCCNSMWEVSLQNFKVCSVLNLLSLYSKQACFVRVWVLKWNLK